MVTVIIAVPSALARTSPFVTETTLSSLLVHLTVLLVALFGTIVAINLNGAFSLIAKVVRFSVTPVTGTVVAIAVTMTSQLAVFPPSSVVAVIFTAPGALAVTLPSFVTVATVALLLVHETVLLVAFSGETVAISVSASFTSKNSEFLLNDNPATAITGGFTVISQEAVKPPSAVVTVIVAVPGALAVIVPWLSTVATVSLLLRHVTL